MISVPIDYHHRFYMKNPSDSVFNSLWNELDWVRVGSTPRREYYCNDVPEAYTYGKGAGVRTYEVQPWNAYLKNIQFDMEELVDDRLEALFLNGYEDNRDWLGWHADDSPEMDDDRPIVIVSFGAEREIRFCKKDGDRKDFTSLVLGHGSVCVMHPGMQKTHLHMIPKSGDSRIEPRVSLTFRGYKHGL